MFTSKNEATLRLANPRKSKTLAIALAPKIFGMDLNFVKNASKLFLDCEHILSSPLFSTKGPKNPPLKALSLLVLGGKYW